MGDWPILSDGGNYTDYGTQLSTTLLTTVTAGGANTKGAWSEIVSGSNNINGGSLIAQFGKQSAAKEYLCDVGIGDAGNEVVIIPNILLGVIRVNSIFLFKFPISIPKGQRIAVRCQCGTAAATITAGVTLISSGFLPSTEFSKVTTYGAIEASTLGTLVDPGTSANTKGSFSQLTSSTNGSIKNLILIPGANNYTGHTEGTWMVDIAIGAAGSEKVIIPNLLFSFPIASGAGPTPLFWGPFPVNIPDSTRLAVRAQSTIASAVERRFDCIIMGVN